MNKKIILVFLFFSLFLFANVYSQGIFDLGLEDEPNKISLEVGEVNVIKANTPQRVAVRNPQVIGIGEVKEDEIIITAEQQGETVLTIWGADGEHNYYITVSPIDPGRLKEKLTTVINENLGIEDVYFKKNELNGKIMILGTVTKSEKERIDMILASFYNQEGQSNMFDNLVVVGEERKMVMIETRILEVTKSFADTLGFDWPGVSGSSPQPITAITAPQKTGTFTGVFQVVDWTRAAATLNVYLDSTQGKGKILARPKLLCLSGQEADFLVGGEIPIVKITATTEDAVVAEDVEYKEYGVKLNIRPQVTEDDQIKLNLTTEVKELSSEGQYVRADGTVIKAFTTRNVSSVLRLNPGQGVIISGLLKDKVTKDDISEVPGLADIPILGALFRSKDYQEDQTELVISLVPKVIDSGKPEIEKALSPDSPDKDYPPVRPPTYLQKNPVLNNYILKVQKNIYEALRYPRMAQEAGWQGNTRVKLHLNYNGDVLDVKVTKSSGYITFDKEIVELVKSLTPYPPFPPSIELQDLWIEVPVVYKMD